MAMASELALSAGINQHGSRPIILRDKVDTCCLERREELNRRRPPHCSSVLEGGQRPESYPGTTRQVVQSPSEQSSTSAAGLSR